MSDAIGKRPEPQARELDPQGMRVALVFAMAAQCLHDYYEHAQWAGEARLAQLAAEWLARTRNALPLAERRALAGHGLGLARHIAATLSRQAGLYTAHEMMEALDPNHRSEIADAMLVECQRLLAQADDETTGGS